MKNRLKNSFIIAVVCAAGVLVSCSDWTDTESLDLKQPGIADQNPELYQQYLQSLRDYRGSDHKILYVDFDNSEKTPMSRGQNFSVVPDSVDIIALTTPSPTTDNERNQMRTVRERGTKVVYTLSYSDLETQYKAEKKIYEDQQTAEGIEEIIPFTPLPEYIAAHMPELLGYCTQYGYDGITVLYNGLSTQNMTEEELVAYTEAQDAFIGAVLAWKKANATRMLNFAGLPQNLLDRTILASCDYLILLTQYADNTHKLYQEALYALRPGVPTHNLIFSVQTFSLDKTDDKTGYFVLPGASEKTSALLEAAYWVRSEGGEPFTKAGLAIFNVQNDYYNTKLVYTYTRGASAILNPTPKN